MPATAAMPPTVSTTGIATAAMLRLSSRRKDRHCQRDDQKSFDEFRHRLTS
jgi:hypothetical protein